MTGLPILSTQGLDHLHLLEEGEGPASLDNLLRGRRGREFPCVAALSVLDSRKSTDVGVRPAPRFTARLSLVIRDKVFERRQQKRTKLATAWVGDPDGAFLQELDEERLDEVAGIFASVSLAPQACIQGVPVGSAQRRQRLFGVR